MSVNCSRSSTKKTSISNQVAYVLENHETFINAFFPFSAIDRNMQGPKCKWGFIDSKDCDLCNVDVFGNWRSRTEDVSVTVTPYATWWTTQRVDMIIFHRCYVYKLYKLQYFTFSDYNWYYFIQVSGNDFKFKILLYSNVRDRN